MPLKTSLGHTYDSGDFQAYDRRMKAATGPALPRASAKRRARQTARHRHGDLYRALRRRLSGDRAIEFKDDRVDRDRGQPVNRHRVSSTAYKQLVSDQLGIRCREVSIVIMGDTDRAGGRFTGGSRCDRWWAAWPLYEAADTIIEQGQPARRRICSKSRADDIVFADGAFTVSPAPTSVDLFEVANGSARSGKTAGGHGARARYHAPSAGRRHLSQWLPCRRGRDRSRYRRSRHRTLYHRRRFRPHHQSAAAGGPSPWRHRAGHRPGSAGARRIRSRQRTAPGRIVHGLCHAARRRHSELRFCYP